MSSIEVKAMILLFVFFKEKLIHIFTSFYIYDKSVNNNFICDLVSPTCHLSNFDRMDRPVKFSLGNITGADQVS